MNYIIESICVGVYSSILYLIISKFINNLYLLLFVVGNVKHLFGYVLNIHTIYCNYGYACNNYFNSPNKTAVFTPYLWGETLIEGLLYLFCGSILILYVSNKLFVFFIIGIILHIVFEKLQIHKLFCKTRCIIRPF